MASSLFFGQSAGVGGGGNEKSYTLSGTVVNSITGAPVPRALVQIFENGPRQMLTDADGRFSFSGLQEGQTGITAEKPGFFQEAQTPFGGGWPPPTSVTMGPDAPDAVVKLVPESVIAGRIVSSGQPLENVPVQVIASQILEGHKEWTVRGNSSTDEDGQFRIANLQAGDYYLQVGPKWQLGGVGVLKGHQAGYARMFYPSMPGAESGGLTVGVGQHTDLELSLETEPWYRIHGAVRTTEATNNWNLQLLDGLGEREEPVRRDPQTGEFDTWAPAGNYTLRLMGFGDKGITGSTNAPLAVNSDVSGVLLGLTAEISIPVAVKRESSHSESETRAASGGRVKLARDFQGQQVAMWFRRSGFSLAGVPSVRPDESGKPETLAVRDIEPGTYWVDFGRNPPWYVASAQCGDVDLLSEPLTVNAGVPCRAIEVVLREDGASLSVTAQWEGAPEQAYLLLIPENESQQAVMSPLSRTGQSEVDDLAPGAYNVVLVDRPDGLEYKSADAMSGYASKGARVVLAAGQKASVRVELVRR